MRLRHRRRPSHRRPSVRRCTPQTADRAGGVAAVRRCFALEQHLRAPTRLMCPSTANQGEARVPHLSDVPTQPPKQLKPARVLEVVPVLRPNHCEPTRSIHRASTSRPSIEGTSSTWLTFQSPERRTCGRVDHPPSQRSDAIAASGEDRDARALDDPAIARRPRLVIDSHPQHRHRPDVGGHPPLVLAFPCPDVRARAPPRPHDWVPG